MNVTSFAAADIGNTINSVQEYRDYKDKMNNFTSKLEEIIYLCDMIDIDRIDQFLINFLETYNFYKEKEEDGKEDDETGYSDLSSEEENIKKIKKGEYSEMIKYISENSEKIVNMQTELDKLYEKIKKYIDNNPEPENTIKTDLLNQKQNIIEQLEKITRLFEIRTNIDSIVPLPFEKLKFYDVSFINKNDIMCKISYSFFKKLYKKLHVLNNEDSQLNNKFDEVFKYEFYIIYTNLHKDFKDKLEEKKPTIQQDVIKSIKEIKDAFTTISTTQQPS